MIIAQLATSSSPFYWYLTRDMAIAAYFTLTLAVLFGLAISLARVTGERVVWHIQDLHYTFATLTAILMAGHMITLLLDTYLPFSLANSALATQPTDQYVYRRPGGTRLLRYDNAALEFLAQKAHGIFRMACNPLCQFCHIHSRHGSWLVDGKRLSDHLDAKSVFWLHARSFRVSSCTNFHLAAAA